MGHAIARYNHGNYFVKYWYTRARNLLFEVIAHWLIYISGLSFLSIASRARKIRDLTVPTGHDMASAISS